MKDDMRVLRGRLDGWEITFLASQAMFYDPECKVEYVYDVVHGAQVLTAADLIPRRVHLRDLVDVTEL